MAEEFIDNSTCTKNKNERFDCHPEPGGDKNNCVQRGCCWDESIGEPGPACFYPTPYNGYKIVNKTEAKMGMQIFLTRIVPSAYPGDVNLVKLDVHYLSSTTIHVKIMDANNNRYEPPFPQIPTVFTKDKKEPMYNVTSSHHGFKITRSNGDLIFDCQNIGGFIFADQFLQISGKISGKIYGLGEHESSLQLNTNWTKFTMFNHDGVPIPNFNLYGSHPFYMSLEESGMSHGVFLHNSNAMEVLLQPLPAVTFRSIGGIFDFYFFLGPTPADVVRQYTDIIGRPFIPPYWSLGFHLSRLGYRNTEHIRSVWNRTRDAQIPFDTQWHDIDYMDRRNDFTYDKKNYPELPEFVDELHQVGMHYVPILDPGISGCEPDGTYPPYDEGLLSDAFVKNQDGSIFVGKVWNPKCTVFPDFTSPNTVVYWGKEIQKFYKKIKFDGIWIDMNEPSNFLDGGFKGCPSNKWENPPYVPQVIGGKLFDKTVCMSTKQYAGLHYDLHNLYGISEAIATNRALKQLGKRPFIISRSTYPGSGSYAGHWSGDVVSTWHAMKTSVPQLLAFSLFGIPMMGADICGFNGNTTEPLCQRWSQLGAFYPFSRNHNTDDAIDQDPVALGEENVNSTRKALMIRYTLLPYLYTLFFKAHVMGETVARPLFFEFWDDPRTLELDESFLWGCCLLIVPVLKEHSTTVSTYLPRSRWYDWYTFLGTESNGTNVVLHAPFDTIPIFIRGGIILPTQKPEVTTTLSRLNDIDLIVASNKTLQAFGTLYWDDGESLDVRSTKQYGLVDFTLTPNNLTSSVTHWGYAKILYVGSIKILGFVKPITELLFNNVKTEYEWNKISLVLTVKVKHPVNVPFTLSWQIVGQQFN
ncbi:hypothetical protein RUM44_009791 [Polyplax serrata]|uniref:P-type domain-containing protein n=1 Tax=Polyplax serrata TaxID=468196 RepID=A0ABR1ATP1_POLSC